jgi:hypothetical protein
VTAFANVNFPTNGIIFIGGTLLRTMSNIALGVKTSKRSDGNPFGVV